MRCLLVAMNCLLLLGLVPLTGCQHQEQTAAEPQPAETAVALEFPQALRPTSRQELEDYFASQNYNWDTVPDGVPPFILETLPEDLHRAGKIIEKKRLFFLSLLPMVLIANDEIRTQRHRLVRIFDDFDRQGTISDTERERLDALQKAYAVEGNVLHDPDLRRILLRRVDVIPPSLVLAQAANESAYGTSRFARRANNIFGEWTFVPGTGLVPLERPAGASYEVRRFPTVAASLHSYMKNINTHSAYRSLRVKRARLRAAGQPLRGLDLADGLEAYSIRGGDYVDELREIIRNNRLSRLSAATLRPYREGKGLLSTSEFSHRSQVAEAGTRAD